MSNKQIKLIKNRIKISAIIAKLIFYYFCKTKFLQNLYFIKLSVCFLIYISWLKELEPVITKKNQLSRHTVQLNSFVSSNSNETGKQSKQYQLAHNEFRNYAIRSF